MNSEVPVIAYLGPRSSYTYQAAEKCFPGSEFTLTPRDTIQEVVDAVEAGRVDRGVIPFENSSNGTVVPTLDTLSTSHLECSDLTIVGETTLKVSHCLLIRSVKDGQDTPPESPSGLGTPTDLSEPATPSPNGSAFAEMRRIKHVYSHPQALGQCREFLAKTFPWAEMHHTTSTAEAAAIVTKDLSNASAAIGSSLTAKHMGLQVLMEDVQDIKENSTRFLIVKKDPLCAPPWHAHGHPDDEDRKLLVSFAVDQRDQSKLVAALSTFNRPGIQLRNVHSRPSRKSPFHYVYFVEVEWRAAQEEGKQVNEALVELGRVAQSRRCHGSWGPTLVW